MGKIINKFSKTISGLLFLFLSTPVFAGAPNSQYPWDKFLKTIADNLSSTVVLLLGIIAIVICGLIMAFTDLQGGGKKAVQIGIGVSIATSAGSILTSLFGTGAVII